MGTSPRKAEVFMISGYQPERPKEPKKSRFIGWLKRKLGVDVLEAALAAKDATIEEMKKERKSSGLFSTHVTRQPLNLDQVSDIAFPIKGARYVDNEGRAMDEAPCVDVGNNGYRFSTRGG